MSHDSDALDPPPFVGRSAADPASGSAVATFTLVEHNSHWEGDFDCALSHQYDLQDWITASLVAGATSQTDLCILGCGDMLGAIKSTQFERI